MISGRLLLMFVAAAMAQNDLSVDCGGDDSVTVRWRPGLDSSQKLDPFRALLGNCPPSFTVSDDTLLFYVLLRDCGFLKQVTADRVTYSNMLIYDRRPELPFISQSVQCVYDSAVSTTTAFSAVEDENEGLATFSMELMNSDFSAPAPSMRFQLGSIIPIRATVESRSHRPLKIFMESCVAATDANISRAAQVHPIIANVGCLMESKSGNSSFLPRRHPAEIRLDLQAFTFALGQNIFLHCDLEAWDIQRVDRKACHYMQQQRRWELLDDPSQSYACSCCESTCFWRTDSTKGMSARKVLGPFMMEDESQSDTSLDTQSSTEHGLTEALLWLLVVSVAAALVTIMGVLAVSYYLCFWRGGRLGYRPSRDLLTKY
ncbi:zona pellucida sperm-binding protein 3 [Sinocyclocheilus rhinocerous]|uniref:Zona pellucida sperm-binding protein 3-like n=1 Tax=Sinocyclocheilus rhinocerous TaxID=307959 RepID=A0A673JIJ5_9TELE|nr:PREDICTED: zona pellucida sperm-binding protein 3-like [Sinocyclocheilus rhinocerous]